MGDEQDSWFKKAFGVDPAEAFQGIQDFGGQVVQGVQQAVSGVAEAAAGAAKKVTGSGSAPTPKPVVVWNITKACNLRCVHCYASADARPAPGELTYEEGVALLEDLRRFDVPAVLFSGGEPLARPDALRLIARAQWLGLNTTLSTNGVLLDDRTADRIAAMGMRYVGISLDGTRARHDTLRGQRRSPVSCARNAATTPP